MLLFKILFMLSFVLVLSSLVGWLFISFPYHEVLGPLGGFLGLIALLGIQRENKTD